MDYISIPAQYAVSVLSLFGVGATDPKPPPPPPAVEQVVEPVEEAEPAPVEAPAENTTVGEAVVVVTVPGELPDVEIERDAEGNETLRADTGDWPSPIYQCASGTTDAAQLASITGRPVSEVIATLDAHPDCELLG